VNPPAGSPGFSEATGKNPHTYSPTLQCGVGLVVDFWRFTSYAPLTLYRSSPLPTPTQLVRLYVTKHYCFVKLALTGKIVGRFSQIDEVAVEM